MINKKKQGEAPGRKPTHSPPSEDKPDLSDALKASEERYRILAENSAEVVMCFDSDCRHTYVSPSIQRYWHAPAEAFLGKSHEEMGLDDELVQFWESAIKRVFQKGEPESHEFPFEIDGHDTFWEWTLRPQLNGDGEVVSVITYARDITQKHEALRELKDGRAMLRAIFEGTGDILLVHDRRGHIIAANRQAEVVYGFTRDELVTKTLQDLDPSYTPSSSVGEHGPSSSAHHEEPSHPVYTSSTHRAAKGRALPVEVCTSPVKRGDETLYVSSVRDLTLRIQRENEKRLLQEQLREAGKLEAIGRLAGGVAHDFNNLLTGIRGYTELLIHALEMPSKELDPNAMRDDLLEIQSAADRAATVTRQLLAFSRKQIISPKPMSLNEWLTESVDFLQRILGEDIRLSLQPSGESTMVKMDRAQLDNALFHLAANARDAMPRGGRLVLGTAQVEVGPQSTLSSELLPGHYVLLTVTDTGEGMDEETRSKIFEPFFSTKDQGKGKGLGLATVYGIMKQNNGFIDVDTCPGEGTTFNIYLPFQGEVPAAAAKEPLQGAAPSGGETVLLVEDEELLRNFTSRLLKRRGYEVLEAPDGESALKLLEEHDEDVDLLLTDVIMPGMNGNTLFERVQEEVPDIRVVFMSGYPRNTILQKGVLKEGLVFLPKPFLANDLFEALAKAISD